MKSGTVDKKEESNTLLQVLTAHFRALVAARSDETVLRQYSALLRAVKSGKFLEGLAHTKHTAVPSQLSPTLTDEDLHRASLDELDKLVNDESTARKDLERIAIQRFSVPRGSMRSFSNKQMLVEKLRTLIGNERTHETIGAVARGQAKLTSEST
jgi:hypothetical protein